MTTDHPFVIKVTTEGIAHAAMNAAQSDPGMHGVPQALALFGCKPSASPARRNDIKSLEPDRVGEALQARDRLSAAPALLKDGLKFLDDLFRLVAFPTALEE